MQSEESSTPFIASASYLAATSPCRAPWIPSATVSGPIHARHDRPGEGAPAGRFAGGREGGRGAGGGGSDRGPGGGVYAEGVEGAVPGFLGLFWDKGGVDCWRDIYIPNCTIEDGGAKQKKADRNR